MRPNAVYGDIVAIPGFSEPVSSLSHFLAGVLALVVARWMLRPASVRKDWTMATACFVAAAGFLGAMSGWYHSLEPGTELRAVAQRFDHAAIWLMIAASFTAFHIISFSKGGWRWGFLSVVWTAALGGLVLKTLFFESLNELAGLTFYMALGWMGVVTAVKLVRTHGWSVTWPMFAGGLAYTVGAVLEFARTPIVLPHVVGPHELFHVAVIAGLACHAMLVRRLIALRTVQLGLTAPDAVAASNVIKTATPAVAAATMAARAVRRAGAERLADARDAARNVVNSKGGGAAAAPASS